VGCELRVAASRRETPTVALLVVLLLPCAAQAGPVSGTVRTLARPGTVPATAMVYAERVDAQVPHQAARVVLRQRNKTFQPRLLPVPTGSSVEFPNDDIIFHNVFSLSGPQPFDLGLYRSGQTRSQTFNQPGLYRVFCNIHPEMTALILVVPTAHVVLASPDGRFGLDLPPGRYRLTALSERASPVSAEFTAEAGATLAPELTLDESAWIDARHKNKFGQDYPKSSYPH
jgi:plastocyanin